ncbi:hypothetical protein ACFL4W_02345 [Planctomycetota bacterium]
MSRLTIRIIALVLLGTSSVIRAEPPPLNPFEKISACEQYVLIMLEPGRSLADVQADLEKVRKSRVPSEEHKRWFLEHHQDELAVYAKYKQSGLYANDGSAELLWAMNWQYGPGFYIAPDGIHLVVYNDWAESMDDVPVRFYAEGKLIRSYKTGELAPFALFMNIGSTDPVSLDVDYEDVDLADHIFAIESKIGDTYLFDIRTGRIIESDRIGSTLILSGMIGVVVLLLGGVIAWFAKKRHKKVSS